MTVIIDYLSTKPIPFLEINTVIILICVFLDLHLSHKNFEQCPNIVSSVVVNDDFPSDG